MKKIIVLFIITVFVFTSGNLLAQRKSEFRTFGKKMNAELNLNEAQQKSIDDLKADKQKKMIDLKAEIQKKKIDMKKLLSDGLKNEDEFLKLNDNISKLKSEIRTLNAKHLIAVCKILNDEQKIIWLDKVKMNAGRGKRMGGGDMKCDGFRHDNMGDRKGSGMRKMQGNDREIKIEKKIIKE